MLISVCFDDLMGRLENAVKNFELKMVKDQGGVFKAILVEKIHVFKDLDEGIEAIFCKMFANQIEEPEIVECVICFEPFDE